MGAKDTILPSRKRCARGSMARDSLSRPRTRFNSTSLGRKSLENAPKWPKTHDAVDRQGGPIKLALALGQCAPLALTLRKLSRRSERPLAVGAAVPLAAGSDVVLQLDRKGLEPTLGGLAPNAAGGTGDLCDIYVPYNVIYIVYIAY